MLAFGVVCIATAIVGGGLKAFGASMPVLASKGRQQLLAVFGSGLIAVSVAALFLVEDAENPDSPGGGASTGGQPPIVSPTGGGTTSTGGQPPPSSSNCPAELTLSSASAPKGSSVQVFGSCFSPGERVEIRVHVEVVGSATADSDGRFNQTITIPQSAPPPSLPTSISATGRSSIKTASAPFKTE
jgi:hypothetical protein